MRRKEPATTSPNQQAFAGRTRGAPWRGGRVLCALQGAVALLVLAAGAVGDPPACESVAPRPMVAPGRPHVVDDEEVTRRLVPVIGNAMVNGARPFDPAALGVFDPAWTKRVIEPTGAPFPSSGRPAHRWVTWTRQLGAGGVEEVYGTGRFVPAGYHSLLFAWDGSTSQLTQWPFCPTDIPSGESAYPYQHYGFRANACPAYPLSAGDFLPVGATVAETSICLVSSAIGGHTPGWNGLGRPTLDGSVDLVTGLPLARVTDLELPFGGATFRLTRTRAAGPNLAVDPYAGRLDPVPSDWWWDWTGLGWMAGENPVLLIDSALADVDGDNPVTIRLVLDAHTSIPFQRIETSSPVRYEAPPRFRATLRHNGVGSEPPTQYDISLYEGAITYSFVALRADVPENRWIGDAYLNSGDVSSTPSVPSSSHARPVIGPDAWRSLDPADPRWAHDPWDWRTNPGAGIPYIAVCKEVRDRYGNRALMDYQPALSRHMDDPETPDVIECQQDALAVGQLRSIRLVPAGAEDDEAQWTLVYAHRRFPGLNFRPIGTGNGYDSARYDIVSQACPATDPGRYELHGDVAIDRVYVFAGDRSADLPADLDLTLHHTDRPGFAAAYRTPGGGAGQDAHDPIWLYNQAHPAAALPTDWTYQVHYHYQTVDQPFMTALEGGASLEAQHPWYAGLAAEGVGSAPVLALTSVHTRPDPANNPALLTSTHRGYVYAGEWQDWFLSPHFTGRSRAPWLEGILDDRALRLLAPLFEGTDRIASVVRNFGLAGEPTRGEVLAHAAVRFD
ncbi:MAG TPA: hypothetical protein VD963_02500, partial [Phycisphaerales bacterium]|nr:hypothetical protein [Phycisphaerales bacterium]